MDDLSTTFAQLAGESPIGTAGRLSRAGVPERTIFATDPPMWAAAVVHGGDDGLFTFSPNARGCDPWIIVPAGGRSHRAWLDVEDLVAFRPEAPGDWRLYRGGAFILGNEDVWSAARDKGTLQLWSTPLGWLTAEGRGACIVDWRLVPALTFASIPRILCDCPELEDRLRKRFRESSPWPRIESRRPVHRMAVA